MAVALSSLRVTAALDVSAYAAGMAQKIAADREGAASSAAVGAAVAQTDVRLADSGGILGRLSRQYVDGFGSAQKFDKAVRDLGRGIETGNVPLNEAQRIVDGLYKKYNLAADGNALLEKGQVALGAIVTATNNRLAAQAEIVARAIASTQRLVTAQQAQAAVNARLGVATEFGGAGRGEDIAAYGAELDRLRAKYSPMFAAQQAYLSALGEIRSANRVGAISQTEMAAAIDRTKLAFVQQVNAMRNAVEVQTIVSRNGSMAGLSAPYSGGLERSEAVGRANMLLSTLGQRVRAAAGDVAGLAQAGGLAAHQFMNLGYQLNDVVTMLAMGASPFMIIASQGGQIYQILGSSPQGVGGALKEIGVRMLALATPTNLLIAGITAIGAAAVIAYNQWLDGQRRVERSLSGRGRASGATVGDINGIAGTVAGDTGMSVASARDLASTLAATGRIGVDSLAGIAGIAKDLAATLGTDIPGATDLLARSFSDPVEGARLLGDRLGVIDASTQRLITSLVAQNRTMDAQQLLLERTRTGLRDAAELTSGWGRAWNVVSSGASDAWEWVGRAIDRGLGGGTIDEQIAFAQAKIEQLSDSYRARTPQVQATIEFWRKEITRLNGELEKTRKQSEDVRRSLQSLKDIGQLNIVIPELDQRRALGDQAQYLGGFAEDPVRVMGAQVTQEQADLAAARARAMRDDFKTSQEMAIAQAELAGRAIAARSPAEKASIAYQQTYLSLSRENLSEDEKRAQASLAAANASAQANQALTDSARERLSSVRDQIGTAQADIDGIGRTAREAELLRLNWQTYADLRREAERNNVAFDQAQYDRLTRENAELARRNEILRERSLMDDLQFERDQMFRSPQDQAVASRLRSAGLPIDFDSAAASAIRFNEQLALSRDLVSDFAGGFVSEFMNGASAIDAATSALARLGDRLLQLALDQAINALFSNMMGMLGGSSGGTVGSMVGGSFVAAASDPWAGLRFADGGLVRGPGSDRSDNIIARLSPNEFVVNAAATRAHLPTLMAMNSGGIRGFADGGPVSMVDALRGFRGAGNDNGRPLSVNVHVRNEVAGARVSAGSATPQGNGVFDIEVVVSEIEGRLAENIANRRGSLAPAMEASYGLNAMRGRSR